MYVTTYRHRLAKKSTEILPFDNASVQPVDLGMIDTVPNRDWTTRNVRLSLWAGDV